MTNSISEASREVARLSRELDITNADHIALWIEANTIPDEPMSQCASWLACRIVEAHEAAMSRASQPVDTGVVLCVHGKPYPCERQSDWGCKPADCIPLDSEAVERAYREGAADSVLKKDFTIDRCWHDSLSRRALLSLAKPVGGECMVLVPREPTAEMLRGACEKHLPGKPMHDTTPPWPDERYRTDEECPAFVRRRNVWKKMIEAYEATQSDKRGDGR